MRVFKHTQNIFSHRDVVVTEEEIQPLPILCDVCEKESTGVFITIHNPTGAEEDARNCQQTMHFYCDAHEPKKEAIP